MWLIVNPSNRCLTVKDESTKNRTPIILYDNHAKNNQRWMFTRDGQIVSILDKNKCLDVSGGDTTNGSTIILFDRHGGDNQKWKLTLDGAIISALNSNKCLTLGGAATNDTPIVLSDRAISLKPNQIWTPKLNEPVEFPDGSPVPPEYQNPIFTAEGRINCSVDDSARWNCRFEISLPNAQVGVAIKIDDPALADKVAKEFVARLSEKIGNPSISVFEFSPPASIRFSVSLKMRASSTIAAIRSLEFTAKSSIQSVGL